jgi:predicted ATPase/class 3 adenylate cyclase
MPDLPSGTVTLLFTDIEGSTPLLLRLGERYPEVLATQRTLLRAAFSLHGGHEVDTQGDAFFVVFDRATDAIAAAADAQRALAGHVWTAGASVRVRMGIHTGAPVATAEGYAGLDLHRGARIAAAANGGQVLLSEATARLVAASLSDGLDLCDLGEHHLKDLPHAEPLFQLLIAGQDRDFPPIHSLSGRTGNLSLPSTPIIGRSREVAAVEDLLQQDRARLVTITGSGGAGKTRLALEIGERVRAHFPDGVWLIELAALDAAPLVPHAVAQALALREQAGQPLIDALGEHLRSRKALIVLDNCEHLVAACAALTEALLRQCPTLSLLATGREPLNLASETVFRVPGLSLPAPGLPATLESAQQAESVQLFVARAAAVRPDFGLTRANAAAVLAICRNLDGIPLAIELAAARVQVLSVQQIEARLADRFRLLTRSARGVAPRQQTLRATLDWSYELLTPPERLLLRRLAVFAGDWELEAGEAIAAGDGIEDFEVLDLLSALVEKSLVVVDAPDVARFRLLRTIQEYAREKLHDAGEIDRLRSRHRDYYLSRAVAIAAELRNTDEAAKLTRLEQDHDNFRAALRWSLERGESEAALRLAGALGRFWEVRGYLREGRDWLQQAFGAGSAPADVRATALLADGILANRQGDMVASRELLERALTLCREGGDPNACALALQFLGNAADYLQDYERAAVCFAESLALYREAGNRRGVAAALNGQGLVARNRGEREAAGALFAESLTLYRALGYQQGMALALYNLGITELDVGDHAGAIARLEESLRSFRELGDRKMTAMAALVRANATPAEDSERRTGLYTEALTSFRDLGDRLGALLCLEYVARWAVEIGEAWRAVPLLGAAAALREGIGVSVPPSERAAYDRAVASARDLLGAAAFATAWSAGLALTLDGAVELALARESVHA